MPIRFRFGPLFVVCFATMASSLLLAQAPVQKGCAAQHMLESDSNVALNTGKWDEAADLFARQLVTNPDSSAAKVGLVRARLGQGKTAEAFDLASKYVATAPDDALIEDVYGEVRFRRGEVGEAAAAFNKAMHADICLGRVHYDIARFQHLNGNFLTAQKQIDLAHKLAPNDTDISHLWRRLHASRPALPGTEGASSDSCQMDTGSEVPRIPLLPITNEAGEMSGIGMEVEVNGKKRRLEVDSGASGITISRSFADSAGVKEGEKIKVGGLGDEGATTAQETIVDSLRVGGMTFHHCKVTVLDRTRELSIEGLIGPDVFGQWIVTLDTPQRELRLAPLPKRPGDAVETKPALYTSGSAGLAEEPGGPYDRYIAPEMQDWTHIYRSNHFLIMPTQVNGLPSKLFVMDTGAFSGMLSTQVARSVGNLVEMSTIIRGLSGQAAHVYTVDKQVELDFGGVRQTLRGISVMNTIPIGSLGGADMSGFIGFTTLKELVISIDYRDNLVKVVFDPKHGFHSSGRMEY